jgi:hypothetical protein
MPDCGVCIGGHDPDGAFDFYEARIKVARKDHVCGECKRVISKGASYESVASKFDGDFFAFKTCADCSAIRDGFSCDGSYAHGTLWDFFKDYGFAELTTGCLTKVESPSAKAYLIQRWQVWKGLA